MKPPYDDDENEDDDYDKWAREGDRRYDAMIDQMMIEKFHGK